MKRLLSTALGALALVGVAFASPAAYASQTPLVTLGELSASNPTAGFYAKLDASSQSNAWTFTIATPSSSLVATGFELITSVPAAYGVPSLSALTTTLYHAANGHPWGAPIATTSILSTLLPSGYVGQTLTFGNLLAGHYILETIATGLSGQSFSGTISTTLVPGLITPIPAALPLFGSALLGLAGLNWRRARKEGNAAMA